MPPCIKDGNFVPLVSDVTGKMLPCIKDGNFVPLVLGVQ